MQEALPVPGVNIWIRRTRWRLERVRRERSLVRFDVTRAGRRVTFLAPFDRPAPAVGAQGIRRARPQHALARAAQLLGRSDGWRSLSSAIDASVDIYPHQLEPAMSILNGARRILIADEVGLGKTIQAGLLIAEVQRRRAGARTLVLTPSSLREQWHDELRGRFHINAMSADTDAVGRLARVEAGGENPWRRPGVWLASLDYIKQPHVLDALPIDPWDLLVIDEAHGAYGDSDRHTAAERLACRSRRMVLLTATPHSGDEIKFARLVNLGALACPGDEIVVFRRTRADVGLTLERRVRWHGVRMGAAETRLLDVLGSFESVTLAAAGHRRDAALLLLSVFRKRALSTMGAFLASVARRFSWLESREPLPDPLWRQAQFNFGDDSDDFGREEQASLVSETGLDAGRERSWLRRLHALASAAERQESKVVRVASLVARAHEPVVIFTEFRDSLRVLRERLAPIRPTATLHGGLTPDEQRHEVRRFLSGATSVLVATDVAAQGLNLQSRSRWVVNLELPWNPARLEQRAGRVDRIGQRRPVHVTLVVARHGAEAAVIARLARRTGVARQTFGPGILGVMAPDKPSLLGDLVQGPPLIDGSDPTGSVVLCRSWSRAARMAARELRRRRQFVGCWQGEAAAGPARWTDSDRLPHVKALAQGATVLLFSVPILDGSGGVIERGLVALRVPAGSRLEPIGSEWLDVAVEEALRKMAPRARRLQMLRRSEAHLAAQREHAIDRLLAEERGRGELQPGLFDLRAVREAASVGHDLAVARQNLEGRLRELKDGSVVEIGRPTLELVFRRPL